MPDAPTISQDALGCSNGIFVRKKSALESLNASTTDEGQGILAGKEAYEVILSAFNIDRTT